MKIHRLENEKELWVYVTKTTCTELRAGQMLSFLERDIDISVNVFKELEGRMYPWSVDITEMRKIIMWCVYLIFRLFPYNFHLTAQAQYYWFFNSDSARKNKWSTAKEVTLILLLCVWLYSFLLQHSQPLLPFCFWEPYETLELSV